MESGLDIYGFAPSPPCRAVMLFAHALGLVFNLKIINTMAGEQMQPEYLKINPMHTIPAINDSGYVLWESRAFLKYFADKFDVDGKFTMQSPQDNGHMEQILYFDAATIFPRFVDYMVATLVHGEPPSQEKLQRLHEAMQALNILLDGRQYAAGNKLTIADFSLAGTMATIEAVHVDLQQYPHIQQWIQRVRKEIPGYEEINQTGADMLGQAMSDKLASIQTN